MAGAEIDVDSDEFQEWYRVFTTFQAQAISEAQHQINMTINKYVEGGKLEIERMARNRGTSMELRVGGI